MSLVRNRMPRIQEVVLPHLRSELTPAYEGLMVGSWLPPVQQRRWPYLGVRSLGGRAHARRPDLLRMPVIEVTAYAATKGDDSGLKIAENLCGDALFVLWEMVDRQVVIPGNGYLHSYFETMPPTQFDSPYDDTWRIQALVQLGLRPERTE